MFIILPLMATLPESSDQSKMNLIENSEVSESLSLISKDNVNIIVDNIYRTTNSSFNEVKSKIINNFKYNLVFDYLKNENFKYKLAFYEYSTDAQHQKPDGPGWCHRPGGELR